MDTIEIRVEAHDGVPVAKPWAAVFALSGGTIGRGSQNKLVLPEADAQVDPVHAMVRLHGGKAFLTNLCERRNLRVGEAELPPGQETPLAIGSRIQVGPYTLRAALPGGAAADDDGFDALAAPGAMAADDNPFAFIGRVEAGAPARVPAAARASAPAPAGHGSLIPEDFDPFARDIERERREKDPWAEGLPMQNLAEMAAVHDDLLRTLPPIGRLAQPSVLDAGAVRGLPASLDPHGERDPLRLFGDEPTQPGLAPESARLLRGSEMHQALRLPQLASADPLAALASAAATPAAAAPAETPRPAAPPLQAAGLQRMEGLDLAMFDRAPAPAPMSADEVIAPEATVFARFDADLAPTRIQPLRLTPAVQEGGGAPALDLDLDLAPGLSREAQSPPLPPLPSPPTAPLPPPAPNVPTPSPPDPSTVSHPAAADEHALMQALLEGLGLPPERAAFEMTPEFMRRFGELLRTAVQGTMDLLHARAEVKREFRADVTIMANRANNPLKFLPDAEGVLLQMLGQTFPGFTRPVPAMREAFRDLRVHQLALMAGIRAAYAEALSRLDPAELEKQGGAGEGLLARLGRTHRKAALWDDYHARYNGLRRQAEDELSAFSGRSFVKAYDAAADAALCDDELPVARPPRTPAS